jgi:hypothetical protein
MSKIVVGEKFFSDVKSFYDELERRKFPGLNFQKEDGLNIKFYYSIAKTRAFFVETNFTPGKIKFFGGENVRKNSVSGVIFIIFLSHGVIQIITEHNINNFSVPQSVRGEIDYYIKHYTSNSLFPENFSSAFFSGKNGTVEIDSFEFFAKIDRTHIFLRNVDGKLGIFEAYYYNSPFAWTPDKTETTTISIKFFKVMGNDIIEVQQSEMYSERFHRYLFRGKNKIEVYMLVTGIDVQTLNTNDPIIKSLLA